MLCDLERRLLWQLRYIDDAVVLGDMVANRDEVIRFYKARWVPEPVRAAIPLTTVFYQ